MTILVDTPIWSLVLRRKKQDLSYTERTLTAMLIELIDRSSVQLIGLVRQELLSGLREEIEFTRLRNYLRDFPDSAIEIDDYEEAARISNECRKVGITGSSVDMLICAVALRRDWRIFTADRDFVRYARVIPLKLLEPFP
ncbi:MAG TPA: PIN domain-containing protein [Candidatus Sulfotelmatobacter sp.]